MSKLKTSSLICLTFLYISTYTQRCYFHALASSNGLLLKLLSTLRTARKARIKTQQHIWSVTLAGCLTDTMDRNETAFQLHVVTLKSIYYKKARVVTQSTFHFYQHHNNNKEQAHENPTSYFFITYNSFLAILMTHGVGSVLVNHLP